MGLLSRKTPEQAAQRAADRAEYGEAKRGLEDLGRREQAQGIRGETPAYDEANGRVAAAAARLPWYLR